MSAHETKICGVLLFEYGVGLAGANPVTLIWAAEKVAESHGYSEARAELRKVNGWRSRQGLALAYPSYESGLWLY